MPRHLLQMRERAATCEGSHDPFDAVAEGDGEHCLFFRPLLKVETVSSCDLREGAGTALVDQMRPAGGWRCRCWKCRSSEAKERNEFRHRADGKLSAVAPKC